MFRNAFDNFKNWCRHSETIFWARLQIVAGIVWAVISVTDMSPLLTPKWFAIWGIFNGVISEYLRRRNTETVHTLVPDISKDNELVNVTTLVTTPITKVA